MRRLWDHPDPRVRPLLVRSSLIKLASAMAASAPALWVLTDTGSIATVALLGVCVGIGGALGPPIHVRLGGGCSERTVWACAITIAGIGYGMVLTERYVLGGLLIGLGAVSWSSQLREAWDEIGDGTAHSWETWASATMYSIGPGLAGLAVYLLDGWCLPLAWSTIALAGWSVASLLEGRRVSPSAGAVAIPPSAVVAVGGYACYHAARATLDLAMLAIALAAGAPELGGVLVGLPSLGSTIGATLLGGRIGRSDSRRSVYVAGCLGQAATTLPLSAAGPAAAAACGVVIGIVKSPAPLSVYGLVYARAPSRVAASTAWIGVGMEVGATAGRAAGGASGFGVDGLVALSIAWLIMSAIVVPGPGGHRADETLERSEPV